MVIGPSGSFSSHIFGSRFLATVRIRDKLSGLSIQVDRMTIPGSGLSNPNAGCRLFREDQTISEIAVISPFDPKRTWPKISELGQSFSRSPIPAKRERANSGETKQAGIGSVTLA